MAFCFIGVHLISTVLSISSDCGGVACTRFTTNEKQNILDLHNELRDRVAGGGLINENHPAATDMNYLIWDSALENVAQSYADTCPGLASNTNRGITYLAERNLGNTKWGPDTEYLNSFCSNQDCISIGENLFVTSLTLTIDNIISNIEQLWFEEYKDWTYGNHNNGCNTGTCGHYTQMVWANTRYVGCGYANGCGSGDWQ
eukprot:502187_1